MTALDRVAPRLRVRDVRKAAEWYRDRLGFAIAEYHYGPAGTPAFVIVQRGSAKIQLTLAPNGEAPGNPDGTANPGGAYRYMSAMSTNCTTR